MQTAVSPSILDHMCSPLPVSLCRIRCSAPIESREKKIDVACRDFTGKGLVLQNFTSMKNTGR